MDKKRRVVRVLSMCVMLIFTFEIFEIQDVMADSYYENTEEFNSGEPYIIEKEPIVVEMDGVISSADIHIRHTNKNAVYMAASSNKEIGVLASASWSIPKKDLVTFSFRAKKAGSFNVTIKEKIGGKTTELGVVGVTFKKSSRTLKGNIKNAAEKCKRYLKKGIVLDIISDSCETTVQLEIKSIKSLRKTKKKVTAVLELEHKVTTNEYQAYKASHSWYQVIFGRGDGNVIPLSGKLKKGAKTVTVTSGYLADMERIKKGKVYYLTGLDVSKSSPYLIGRKCK